jgi:hypothetical protein
MSNQPRLVLVEWLDSGQPIPEWQWLETLELRRPHRCLSVGFLVQDNNERAIILAPNLGASGGNDEWDQASGLITIPTRAVIRIQPLISSCSVQASCDRDAA